ncbi:MAG: amino acid deaminase/aldolase [Actinobacteria bacterium]|nr:amino acid deaminase/aldolase [Actinomycetota bacterium]
MAPQRSTGDLARYDRATAELDPPFAIVDLDAFWSNSSDLRRRAAGKPLRLASKSVRCRSLQERVLASDGWEGTLSFTLPEALWLADHGFDNLVVAYPTADRGALRALARLMVERPDARVAIMVDSVDHLDVIDRATGPRRAPVQLCLDVDAGWRLFGGRVKIGAKRSPLHSPAEAAGLAREIARRDGFRLVGLMAYEAQIAGVGDKPPGQPLRAAAIAAMRSRSARELATRRVEVVRAVEAVTPLEFVNGGGTGSVELTSREQAVTEVAAGSGLFGPALFSTYRAFDPQPAAFFAVPVVRRPSERVATVLGGGYLASGTADKSRLPEPYLPPGLRLDPQEGAGEVQTPLHGDAATRLQVGDRVYFRHAKAGEMCERFDRLYLIEGDRIVDEVPTYRGEGLTFL